MGQVGGTVVGDVPHVLEWVDAIYDRGAYVGLGGR